jgi:pilus assembly protein CpaC
VIVGKGTILTIKEPSKRVSVSDPAIAEINLISPTQILINGKKVGATTLITWDMQGNTKFFDVRVNGDIDQLKQQIKDMAPNDDIKVDFANDTLVLSGHAANQQRINKAAQLAQAYGAKVLNHIIIEEAQQVLLEVKVAQIDKTKLKQLGISFLVKDRNFELTAPGLFTSADGKVGGAAGTTGGVGATTGVTGGTLGVAGTEITPGIGGFDIGILSPQIGVAHFPSDIAVVLRALQEKGFGKILAEPNLVVRSGEKGNFHVGSRIPIQTVTGVGAAATLSITYEEVGIRLNFAPEVLETGAIRLKIDPAEVSSVARYITFQGIIAPEIDTRRVITSVDLKEGESLILAGLLSDEMKKNIQKIPILGDIPILGAFFRNTRDELKEKELAFFITPRLVKPIPQGVKTELPGEKPLTPEQEREFQWIPLPKGGGENNGSFSK